MRLLLLSFRYATWSVLPYNDSNGTRLSEEHPGLTHRLASTGMMR
jgi:hypothetical protein